MRAIAFLAGAVAVMGATGAAIPSVGAATPSTGATTSSTSIAVVNYHPSTPLPTHMSLSTAQSLQAKADASAIKPSATVTPYSVASGYALRSPGYKRDNYNYDSDWATINTYDCPQGNCELEDSVDVRIHEYITGGYSKSWRITMYARESYNGYPTWHADYVYYCAINVSGNPDHYCKNGADPSGETGAFNNGDNHWWYFENNTYSNIEYPMVGLTVYFSNNTHSSAKFRGWDVCASRSTTKLCAKSGTGA